MMKNQKTDSITDLIGAVQTYFDALYYCDTELLGKVFHKNSSLFDVDSGRVFVEPIDSFSKDVGGKNITRKQRTKARCSNFND